MAVKWGVDMRFSVWPGAKGKQRGAPEKTTHPKQNGFSGEIPLTATLAQEHKFQLLSGF